MSGWQRPAEPGDGGTRPGSGWDAPPDPQGPGQLIRKGWRLYRSLPRPFLVIALVTGGIQAALGLPALASVLGMAEGAFEVLAEWFNRAMADPDAYARANQAALQADLEARLRAVLAPFQELPPVVAALSGLAGAVGLVGTAALTGMALSVAAGRPVPAWFAFRLVAARHALVIPITALGLGWAAVTWLSSALQSSSEVEAWAGQPGSPRSILIGSLLGAAAVVVVFGIVILAVRWALYVPAVLVESLGVGPGLDRAAQLTRGLRIRLGLAMAGILIAQTIVVAIAATTIGFAVGLAAGSVTTGIVAYVVAGLVGGALWAPWLPAMLANAYRERTVPGGPSAGRQAADLEPEAATSEAPPD